MPTNKDFIVCVMDRKNKTQEELNDNALLAENAYNDAYVAFVAANSALMNGPLTDRHVIEYFQLTGENRAEYEQAVRENK